MGSRDGSLKEVASSRIRLRIRIASVSALGIAVRGRQLREKYLASSPRLLRQKSLSRPGRADDPFPDVKTAMVCEADQISVDVYVSVLCPEVDDVGLLGSSE